MKILILTASLLISTAASAQMLSAIAPSAELKCYENGAGGATLTIVTELGDSTAIAQDVNENGIKAQLTYDLDSRRQNEHQMVYAGTGFELSIDLGSTGFLPDSHTATLTAKGFRDGQPVVFSACKFLFHTL